MRFGCSCLSPWIFVLVLMSLAETPACATAAGSARAFDVDQASMPKALAELARQGGIELLFDDRLVAGLKARPVHGRLTPQAALGQLLAGSGVGYRAGAGGVVVLFAAPAAAAAPAAGVGAIAEILVVGRRTQNVDIARSENDIQPYTIATAEDIETAGSDDVDDYLRSREPADTQARPPIQDPSQLGSTRSEIDLRGFGSQQTLVLIDGQRMPSVPSFQGEFDQTDLNGVPVGAIDRIETLTSTAGGIYGPSAIGGVVNVVLKRDYVGEQLNLTTGVSDRGDAAQVRMEGRIGFTPDDGATEVMVFGAYSASQPLLTGQRDLADRARAQAAANDPVDYLTYWGPTSNAFGILSANGAPLTLAPQYGGAALGSTFINLPLNFTGTASQRIAALSANSGKIVTALADDSEGTGSSLLSDPTVTSLIFSVRHRVNPNIELFADGLYFLNQGTIRGGAAGFIFVPAGSPNNPFLGAIDYGFPEPGVTQVETLKTEEDRFTVGLIATLPRGWRATGDIAIGGSTVADAISGPVEPFAFNTAIAAGGPGPGGLPALNPLGDWNTFLKASAAYLEPSSAAFSLTDRFDDASLRLAGPVASLPGGPLTLTLLGEWRREDIPASAAEFDAPDLSSSDFSLVLPEQILAVTSGYAELLAPLVAPDAAFAPVRGLTVQLAARYDDVATTLPENGEPGAPSNNDLVTLHSSGAAYTAGVRVLPTPGLMLRASVSTGALPPSITQFQAASATVADDGTPDPLRNGQPLSTEGPYLVLSGGSHDVRAEQAQTVSVGAVINPTGHGPRLSIDYSRTVTTGEIEDFPLTQDQLLLAEASYPSRVIRAPLTAADKAAGFTVGRVVAFDLSASNAGTGTVDAVDLKLDWPLPATSVGDFRLYGAATWEPNDLQRLAPGQPAVNQSGFSDGPLAVRANLGLGWKRGPVGVDLNVQYFDSYSIFNSISPGLPNEQLLHLQGSSRIPSQVYVDLALSRRFDLPRAGGPRRVLDVRLGIFNLFDQLPPIVVSPVVPAYSPYGDPRGRRFQLTLSSRF